ncbi:hypothetical protein LZ554_000428 [Drepanopeziza brunnea f. sp. 'monogermtubi']|nr:hypothetical protein LZ554_000428 [Drepanopeziza brunnea f. sp. 'monogermtubi']
MALGVARKLKDYWKSFDDTRDKLIDLVDIVTGQTEQAAEFKNLITLLPHLLRSVEKAGKGEANLRRASNEEGERRLPEYFISQSHNFSQLVWFWACH